MNELAFPDIATATAAAIFSFNAGSYPTEVKAYVVEQPSPTAGLSDNLLVEQMTHDFAREIASVFASLLASQEPLGIEFEAVWDANVDKLYEF